MNDAESPIRVTDGTSGVVILTMNRPKQRNAMSAGLVTELIAQLDRLDHDNEVRAIVLAGASGGFCSGSDLTELATLNEDRRRIFEQDSGRLARLILRLSKPVVAAAGGYAIGGGLTLAAACDIVVTDPQSRWSLPEVPIGLFPAWGLALLVDRIGRTSARRLAWGIDTLDGSEAVRIGLADVLSENDVMATSIAIAKRLASLPVMQATSVKTYFATERGYEAGDELANGFFVRSCETKEAAETFRKFSRAP